jgi:hypothetical protein
MNKYRLTITEVNGDDAKSRTVCYEQLLEGIDLRTFIVAINSLPRKRERNRRKKEQVLA